MQSLTVYFTALRLEVDHRLQDAAASSVIPSALRPAAEAALASRGKRIRALLTIAAGEAAGGKRRPLVTAGAAIEMIHTSSLILDDLPAMDDAILRRGEPTLHRAFGEDRAVLTAVGLLNQAYGLLLDAHADARPRRWSVADVLGQAVDAVGWDGTIGGEAVDLHTDGASLDFTTLEYIHSRKTGALFVAAAAIGAMLAGAAKDQLHAVRTYAKNLGLAFQIADDILDVTATAEQLGKDIGKDTARLTFVKLAGVEGARRLCAELVDTAIGSIESLGPKSEPLRGLAEKVRVSVA